MDIHSFIEGYAASDTVRAHMPGHKGHGGDIYRRDITEIHGADSLYEANGIIAASEARASRIFGSLSTLYSCGGSTLCIQTMLALCVPQGGKVAAVRNCHRAFLSACIIGDYDVEWIYPEGGLIGGGISPAQAREVLERHHPVLLYVTSPDYSGNIAPIEELAGICHEYGVILAVDNAHGAYLRFVYEDGRPLHPLFQGADICCDSAHKTLPVLTGGAYLHINSPLEKYPGQAKMLMSTFGSSSPSYLILDSLDRCNGYMESLLQGDDYFDDLRRMKPVPRAFDTAGDECGKLAIVAPSGGYTGHELAQELRERGIECEFADDVYTVLMLTGLTKEELSYISRAIDDIPPRTPFSADIPAVMPHRRVMSLREAFFSEQELLPVTECAGRVCARAVTVCPPGIAVTTGGEVFLPEDIPILVSQGMTHAAVVK